MLSKLARLYIKNLSSEARLVLISMAALITRAGPIKMTSEQWAEELTLPPAVVAPALRELAHLGLIDRMTALGTKGRPKLLYGMGPDHLERLAQQGGGGLNDRGLEELLGVVVARAGGYVRQRLSEEEKGRRRVPPARVGVKSRLSPINRVVLVVLLAFADRSGVVRGVGSSRLSAICGMTVTRLGYQIDKLISLGFVRVYVPGGSGDSVGGVVPGIYFLNLGHPEYGTSGASGICFALPAGGGCLEYSSRQSADIVGLRSLALSVASKAARGISWSPFGQLLMSIGSKEGNAIAEGQKTRTPGEDRGAQIQLEERRDEVLHRLATMMLDAGKHGLLRYLQSVIDLHASSALKKLFSKDQGGNPCAPDVKEIQQAIVQEISPSKSRGVHGEDRQAELTSAARVLLAEFMAQRAISLAEHCDRELRRFKIDGLEDNFSEDLQDCFLIIPWIPGSRHNYLAVVALLGKGEAGLLGSYFVVPQPRSASAANPYPYSQEIIGLPPFSEQVYDYGLFSRDSRKEAN